MELTAKEAWSRILERVKTELPEQSYSTWLEPTSAVGFTQDQLIVATANDFAAEWIEHKYRALLEEVAGRLFETGIRLAFEPGEAGNAPIRPPAPPTARADRESPAREPAERDASGAGGSCSVGTLNPRYTMDRFVVGRNNQLCAAACQAVAEAPGRAYNPLFIYSGVGLGKTHLMHAIGHRVLAESPGARVAYVATEQFMNDLIAAIQARRTAEFRSRYRRIDLLLVDDIHFLADKEGTQEEFFHTFNALYDAQKQIVVTSDRPPKEIPGLQDRLVSRFQWGLVADMDPPDFETRQAILRQKAEDDNLTIPHDVLTFIAEHCRSSVRELEGAVIKLLAYSSLTNREVTLALAEEALGATLADRGPVSPERIQQAVAQAYGLSTEALCSRSRSRDVTLPRQVAMYLMKSMLALPYTQIGRLFGGRDHSTVIHSVRKVEDQAAADSAFAARVEGLRRELL